MEQSQERNPAVEMALRTRSTGFGGGYSSGRGQKTAVTMNQRAVTASQREVAASLGRNPDDPREVSWTVNGDGTATCADTRLMWIQAPWGHQWEGGSEFSGTSHLVSWIDAKRLFGCGTRVGFTPDHTIGLSADQVRSTGIEFGYKRGICRVDFAGYSDWRLPTFADWTTLMGLDAEKRRSVLHLAYDQDYWSATEVYSWGTHDSFIKYLPLILRRRIINYSAWAACVERWIIDLRVETCLPIMFVRNA